MQIKSLSLLAAFVLGAAGLFAQTGQTFTGTVTDSMCGAHHMMKNETPAQCTRECVKQGSDFALANGSKLYILKGDKSQLDKFAGESVVIKGTSNGNTITVNSIKPTK